MCQNEWFKKLYFLRVAQRALVSSMLGVTLMDKIRNSQLPGRWYNQYVGNKYFHYFERNCITSLLDIYFSLEWNCCVYPAFDTSIWRRTSVSSFRWKVNYSKPLVPECPDFEFVQRVSHKIRHGPALFHTNGINLGALLAYTAIPRDIIYIFRELLEYKSSDISVVNKRTRNAPTLLHEWHPCISSSYTWSIRRNCFGILHLCRGFSIVSDGKILGGVSQRELEICAISIIAGGGGKYFCLEVEHCSRNILSAFGYICFYAFCWTYGYVRFFGWVFLHFHKIGINQYVFSRKLMFSRIETRLSCTGLLYWN